MLGIELPDTPWGRAYYGWAIGVLAELPVDDTRVGVMLSSMANFREPQDSRLEAARCLRSLLEAGRPPLDHVVQVLRTEGETPQPQDGGGD